MLEELLIIQLQIDNLERFIDYAKRENKPKSDYMYAIVAQHRYYKIKSNIINKIIEKYE